MNPPTCQKSGGFHQHGIPQKTWSDFKTAGARRSPAVFLFPLPHRFSECDLECTHLMKTARFLAGPPSFFARKESQALGMGASNGTRFGEQGERALRKCSRLARQRCPVGALKQAVQPIPSQDERRPPSGGLPNTYEPTSTTGAARDP